MFVDGRVYLATCVSVVENATGSSDVAAMRLVAEVPLTVTASAASPLPLPPHSEIAPTPAQEGDDVFCVGNPSSIDLESTSVSTIQFQPATWHVSVGRLISTGKDVLEHSCWTYWGHSGAPIFNRAGQVVGLHCAWNDCNGLRQGQQLEKIQHVVTKVTSNVKKRKQPCH